MLSFGNIWRRLKSSTGQLILCERKPDLIHPLPDLQFESKLHLNPFNLLFGAFKYLIPFPATVSKVYVH